MTDEKIEKISPLPGQLPVNQETLDILVANIIPTSKYFEARFDHMENRIERIQRDLIDFRKDVDRRFDDFKIDNDKRFVEFKSDIDQRFEQVDQRFAQVDKRFEQVDRRFEQIDKRFELVDKRFEQMDKRFEQMIFSIDKLTDKLDHRDERQRSFILRMFTISITISILGATGAFLKALAVF